jgi:hypothetical protein
MLGLLGIGDNAAGGQDVGDIGHSLRCRSAASAYLSRTFGTPTANTSWALSFWVKDSGYSAANRIVISSGYSSVGINTSNQLTFWDSGGGQIANSASLARDPTGHQHYFVRSNGTNIKGYRNNVELLSYTGTAPGLNSAAVHNLFRMAALSAQYFDGYFSRVCFVDNGGSLTPSSFGYFNTQINEWVSKTQSEVKAVVDAGGTNSFMLDFDDGASLTTLGYDKSSKANNWTLNNFSLTAGTTYDWMLDVPGNSYCVGSPINTMLSSAYAEGNLKIGTGSAGLAYLHACTQAMTTGKWYFEAVHTGYSAGSGAIGIFKSTASLDAASSGGYANTNWYGYANNGQKFNGASQTAYGATYNATAPDVVACAYDADAGSVEFFKNGVSQGVAFTGVTGGAYPAFMAYNGNYFVLCAGQAPLHASATYDSASGGYFRYTPPTGFKALCQANLPTPAILNPELHMDVKLDTGANIKTTAESVFPSNFFEWIKDRGNSNNHQLIDTVRGSSAVLQSNTTAAETTYSAPSGSSVGWVWKAGGTAATNNAGSISSQVSANVDAGFSIVTYTGTGANATVGHGLGVAPKMYVTKRVNNTGDWPVYHVNQNASPGTGHMKLNLTGAFNAGSTVWNNTAPTSSVFSVGSSSEANASLGTYVAYCFAEIDGYSKIGSYTGNGSTDGPFVECGFKPKFVMIKRSDSTGNWVIYDTVRNTYNVVNLSLFPNLSNAEFTETANILDAVSNGFKPRGTGGDINTSGGTYTFIAFADVAAKYSLAR